MPCRSAVRARLLRAPRTVDNPGRDGAYSGEAVFLCIANAPHELPLLAADSACQVEQDPAIGSRGAIFIVDEPKLGILLGEAQAINASAAGLLNTLRHVAASFS